VNKKWTPTVKRGRNFLSCVSGIRVPLKQTIGYSPTLIFLGALGGLDAKLNLIL